MRHRWSCHTEWLVRLNHHWLLIAHLVGLVLRYLLLVVVSRRRDICRRHWWLVKRVFLTVWVLLMNRLIIEVWLIILGIHFNYIINYYKSILIKIHSKAQTSSCYMIKSCLLEMISLSKVEV